MICAECDRLDKNFIRPRDERAQRIAQGTLNTEIEARLGSEEGTALAAIQDHRINDHQPGDTYE
ncbi:MAG: hypothetical protein DMG32_03740 [Acidobacteria bacterium]|nr:MAG: hypothetical protein DMG32_03740 [Acidobacteriota bacterium]